MGTNLEQISRNSNKRANSNRRAKGVNEERGTHVNSQEEKGTEGTGRAQESVCCRNSELYLFLSIRSFFLFRAP
jgi:hypothetical protein